uniref:Nuclear transport factor 2 family protein n=1 Tax=Roseihalotalea indica TaxID=2867963 RepID=A0AA49GSV6_9BACT|nr:nuclear transport factor 2 family protein [Tunicatimonas sp. TK19036]
MKKLLLVLIACLGVHIIYGQSSLESSILALEKSRFDAMVRKDINKLNSLISDDLCYVHSNGKVDTKESFIGAIEAGSSSYDDITVEKANVRIYENTAIINGECTYHRKKEDGSPDNVQLRYTNVYVKQNGEWQMVSWQSYRIS